MAFAIPILTAFRRATSIHLAVGPKSADRAVYGSPALGPSLELAPLWTATHERLNLYHAIATKQAKDSFYRAQAAMTIGFAIIAVSIVATLLAGSAAASITSGLLGAVAAALSGYISHTFIRSQENAAQHLRAYFLQPLEFSRYLVAERLLGTLNDDRKAEGILSIVQGISGFPTTVASDEEPRAGEPRDAWIIQPPTSR